MCVHPRSWCGHCVAAHCTRGDWSYPSELVMVGGNHESSSPTCHMSGFTLVVAVLLSSVRHVAVATLLSTLSLAALISRSSLYKLHPTFPSPPPPCCANSLALFYCIFFIFVSPATSHLFPPLFYAKVAVGRRKCFYFFRKTRTFYQK